MNWGVNDTGGQLKKSARMQNAASAHSLAKHGRKGIKEIGSFVNKFVPQDEMNSFISNERHIKSILFRRSPTFLHVNIMLNWLKYVRIFHEGTKHAMHVNIPEEACDPWYIW